MPQASCVVTFSIFLVFQLSFMTLLCSLASRATFVVMCSVFHIFFVSQVSLYKTSLWSLGPQTYFVPSESSPFVLILSTEDGQYPKSRGRATGHLGPLPKSSGLATRCDQDSTTPTVAPGVSLRVDVLLAPPFKDLHYHLSPSPALSGSHTACLSAIDAAFLVLPDDGTSAPLPSTSPPSSQLCRLAPGIIETSISAAIPQFLPDPSPDVPSFPVMTPVYPSPPEAFAHSVLLDPSTSTLSKRLLPHQCRLLRCSRVEPRQESSGSPHPP